MTRSSRLLSGFAAVAALCMAGCSHLANGPKDGLDIDTRYPIMVEPHMEALRLPYDGPRGSLDDNQSAELKRFARDYLDNGSGAIAVSAPRRLPDAPNYFAERLVALGVPRSRIMVGNDDNPDSNGDVKLTYIRYQARTEACGDWSVNLGYTADNKASPNFGCATHHNIAAMVADPRDLVAPKAMDPDDAQRRLTVLEKYRKGETTVSTKAQEQSGAVTDVAGGKM
jgi:pilus assembly protein CpaD